MNRRWEGALVAAALVAASAGPLVATGLLARLPSQIEVGTRRVEPLLVEVESQVTDAAQAARAKLTWRDGDVLRAPGWSGTVTEVLVRPNQVVSTGKHLVQIDGVDRIAAATPQPFYRSLSKGDRGADVASLNGLLASLGLPCGDGDVWSSATATGVSELGADLGLVDSPHAFDPTWIVWAPRDSFEVKAVSIVKGAPAPTMGEPLATGPARLVAAGFTMTDSTELDLPEDSWLARVGDTDIPLTPQATLGKAGLERLATLVPDRQEEVNVRLRLAAKQTRHAVPPATVQTDSAGTYVWVEDVADAGGYSCHRVEIEGGTAAASFLTAESAPDSRVLANPSEVLEGRPCR